MRGTGVFIRRGGRSFDKEQMSQDKRMEEFLLFPNYFDNFTRILYIVMFDRIQECQSVK
jgi:hypothetical protein